MCYYGLSCHAVPLLGREICLSCLLQFGKLLALHSFTESHNLDNSYLAGSSLFQRAYQLGDEEIFRREVQKGRNQWPHVWYNCKRGLTWADGLANETCRLPVRCEALIEGFC